MHRVPFRGDWQGWSIFENVTTTNHVSRLLYLVRETVLQIFAPFRRASSPPDRAQGSFLMVEFFLVVFRPRNKLPRLV